MRFMRLRNFRRNDEGFSLVFVGVGMMALVGVSMLAIDVGQMMTARSQAQNSADAGALAGATALYYNSWTDRTASGPAVTNALAASLANKVIGDNVSITPADVDFPLSPTTGEANRVHVTVYRDASHGNPVSTLIAHYFGISTVDIAATATAEVAPATAMTCVLPFTIPDRWNEVRNPPFTPDSSFDKYASKNVLLANPDIYIGPTDKENYTGYDAVRDRGMRIQLKADNGTKLAPSFYYPYAIPASTGASDYRESIGGCNTTRMEPNQLYDPEPGMMTGPTKQGMDDLIALDPDATWDEVNKRVISTKHPSPRVRAIPLFDPGYYQDGKLNGRNASLKFVNYLGFFIEKMDGNDVYGRITPIGGLSGGTAGPPSAIFPAYIRLVQ
jgi:Flp pilus assembly protein TadG